MNHSNRSQVRDWPVYLRAFRLRHGLTQKQLAYKLPATLRIVEDWEQGKYPPTAFLKRALRDLACELASPS
jgi:DNA-binding transcriptional regulator YiaG